MWDFHHFCQIYQPILAILKVPKIPPLLGNSTKTVQLHKFLRDPRCFLLDHHSSYHYGHPAQPACTFHRKNPIDPARRPPSTTRAASAARQASTTASQDFFFFFTRYYYYRMPFSSISPPVIILWWIFSSELILLFPFLTRFVVKQKNNNST